MRGKNILLQISKDLESATQRSNQSSNLDPVLGVHEILRNNGGKLAYLNKFLVINELPVLPKLKPTISIFKVFLYIFFTGFILLVSSLFFFINKYTPIYEMNKMDNTISLFGGKFLMENDSENYFQNRGFAYASLGISYDSLNHDFSSIIASKEFSSVEIIGKNLDLIIQKNLNDEVKLNCKTFDEENNMAVDQIRVLKIDLGEMSQCHLWIPPQKWLTIKSDIGAIFIKSIDQSFLFDFKKSYITFKKENLNLFKSLRVNVNKGKKSKISKLNGISKNTGEINIEEGEFKVR